MVGKRNFTSEGLCALIEGGGTFDACIPTWVSVQATNSISSKVVTAFMVDYL